MTPRASLLAFPLAAMLCSPAMAFDCAKAGTAVEKAICAEPALKQLDDQLGQAYSEAKAGQDAAGQAMLARSQKRWIAEREGCGRAEDGIAACVRQKTAERLNLLAGTPESGPGAPSRLMPVFLVQDGTTTQWDIDISAFRFAEPKTAGELAFNAYVEAIMGKAKLGPHGEDTQGMVHARQDRLSLTYASPRLLSVRHAHAVNEGGAHGIHGTENLNLDMGTGRPLDVKDVLSEPSAAILTLWCGKQIAAEKRKRVPGQAEDPAEEASRDEAIAARVRDLAGWSIGESDIVVSFDPDALGAYAEGSYACRFPTEGVKRLALPGAVLP